MSIDKVVEGVSEIEDILGFQLDFWSLNISPYSSSLDLLITFERKINISQSNRVKFVYCKEN